MDYLELRTLEETPDKNSKAILDQNVRHHQISHNIDLKAALKKECQKLLRELLWSL